MWKYGATAWARTGIGRRPGPWQVALPGASAGETSPEPGSPSSLEWRRSFSIAETCGAWRWRREVADSLPSENRRSILSFLPPTDARSPQTRGKDETRRDPSRRRVPPLPSPLLPGAQSSTDLMRGFLEEVQLGAESVPAAAAAVSVAGVREESKMRLRVRDELAEDLVELDRCQSPARMENRLVDLERLLELTRHGQAPRERHKSRRQTVRPRGDEERWKLGDRLLTILVLSPFHSSIRSGCGGCAGCDEMAAPMSRSVKHQNNKF